MIRASNNADVDTKEILAELQKADVELPRFAFINACESAREKAKEGVRAAYNWAYTLASCGCSALIATLWSIDDEPSSSFSEWFYKQLIEKKRSIGDALRLSRRHILRQEESIFTYPAYALYGYPHLTFEEIVRA